MLKAAERKELTLKNISAGLDTIANNDNRWSMVYDLDVLEETIQNLKKSFPEKSKHCFALKACPLPEILKIFKKNGIGMECATFEEVQQAVRCGFDSSKIVFDSPIKTIKEIEESIKMNLMLLNVDNIEELKRVKEAIKKFPKSTCNVSLRINPQLGAGKTVMTSTAIPTAKFGFPLKDFGKENLVNLSKEFPFIRGLHVHVGSGGMHFGQLTDGAKHILELAQSINKALGKKQIEYIDIGGGFPVPMDPDTDQFSFDEYWNNLKTLKGIEEFNIVTEFGRGLIHRAGLAVSRVEYVKYSGGHQIGVVHCGSDMFTWAAYTKGRLMTLPMTFMNSDGSVKDLEAEKKMKEDELKNKKKIPESLDIVGPLCFTGDIIGWDKPYMPTLKPEDVIVIHSIGAYTLSLWNKFNSRSLPPVFLMHRDGKFTCIKKKEEIEKTLAFWD